MSCFKWKMKSEVSLSFWKGNTITLTVPDGCLLRKPDKANASQSVQNVRCKHQIEIGPSKYIRLLLLRNHEHLLVLSKNRLFLPPSNTLKFPRKAENTEVPWSHQGNNSPQLI